MKITTKVIEKMNPCKDRFDNWLKNHEKASLTLKQFFALEDITHLDKVWVSVRLLSRQSVEIFALDMALSAVQYNAAAYSAANAAEAYTAYAAEAAAYTAYAAEAAYTAYAAEAAYAADAAAYAAAYAAYSAANAAEAAANARAKEQESQLEVLLYLLENEND